MDISSLWDFDDAQGSLARFDAAATVADEPDASILRTQQARALGLLDRFAEGHELLDSLTSTDDEVRARVLLERGRLFRSAANSVDGSGAMLELAQEAFEQAAAATGQAASDVTAGLHLDALHMLALLPDDPTDQVAATRRALEAVRASHFPSARRWEASLLNNLGMALHDAGDDQAALEVFIQAVEVRRGQGQRRPLQIALWCQGWALRLVGRTDEARALQLALREELLADGIDDRHVAEELELLGH